MPECPNPDCRMPVAADDAFCPRCGTDVARGIPASRETGRAGTARGGRDASRHSDVGGAIPGATAGPELPEAGFPGGRDPASLESFAATSPAPLESFAATSASPRSDDPPPSSLSDTDTVRLRPPPLPSAASRAETVVAEDLSECPDLRIRFDTGRLFMEGVNTPFRIRLESCGETVRDVSVRAASDGMADHELVNKTFSVLKPGRDRELMVNCRPPEGAFGLLALDWSIAYTRDGQRRVYEAQSEFPVYCKDQSPHKVVNEVVFNFERIELNNASDLEIKDAVNFYKDLGDKQELTVNDLVAQARKAPPVWELLALFEDCVDPVVPRPAPPPPPDALTRRATVVMDGQLVHLLAGGQAVFGRNRETVDVCTRLLDACGTATPELNLPISQQHFRLVVEGGRCLVLDGAEGRRSTHGTYVDGERLGAEGLPLPENEAVAVSLGNPASGLPLVGLSLRMITCQSLPCDECPLPDLCDDRGSVACVIASRTDGAPEHYVLLDRLVPLSRIHPGFGRLKIGFSHGAFCYQSPREAGWLKAGTEFIVRGGKAVVRTFQQFGLPAPPAER